MLDDLADVFARVRTWDAVVEKKIGLYYLRRTPFLHFHVLRSGRVADARDGHTWGARIDLPYPSTAARRRALLRELRARYERTLAPTPDGGGR